MSVDLPSGSLNATLAPPEVPLEAGLSFAPVPSAVSWITVGMYVWCSPMGSFLAWLTRGMTGPPLSVLLPI